MAGLYLMIFLGMMVATNEILLLADVYIIGNDTMPDY